MKYPNPLDEFQSHSVHYVMLASRSTADVRAFTLDNEAAASSALAAIDAAQALGDLVVAPGGSQGSTYLLIDTRRFSQYSITDFSMVTHLTATTIPGASSPNSVAQQLTFTVSDSTGISYANFLQYLMHQKLQVTSQGMCMLLRIMFMGHTADGQTKLVQSIGIPMIMGDIHVDLNEVKGLYHCKAFAMVGMASNSGYNAYWTNIGTASSYFTGLNANKLGPMVASFESRLNAESLERYRQSNTQTGTSGTSAVNSRFGRPVQFMITLPSGWSEFAFSGRTQGSINEINFKDQLDTLNVKKATASRTAAEQQRRAQLNATVKANDSFIAVDPDNTITEVLDLIFSQTIEIAKLGNFTKGTTSTEIKFYKHLISVTSDDSSFTVHVDVVLYTVLNTELNQKSVGSSSISEHSKLFFEEQISNGRVITVPRNFLEYDYIFSGKNLDVMSLDLKIEHLNYILMQSSTLGQGNVFATSDVGQKQVDGVSVISDNRVSYGMASKDPLLLPLRTGDERSNFSNLGANIQGADGESPQAIRQQYIRNISSFYNAGPLQAKMTVRGNPLILERIALTTIPEHVSSITIMSSGGVLSNENESVKQKYRAALEANLLRLTPGLSAASGGGFKVSTPLNGPSHLTSPVYIKVNVFGPNVNFLTQERENGAFAERLFYDNYYYLWDVTTRIEGSKFTQEFNLSPLFVSAAQTNTMAKGTDYRGTVLPNSLRGGK